MSFTQTLECAPNVQPESEEVEMIQTPAQDAPNEVCFDKSTMKR